MEATAQTLDRVEWRTLLPIVFVHMAPLGALWTGVTAFDLWLCLALYVARMFFVTAGYHRLMSHNSYRTSRWFRRLTVGSGLDAD